MRFESLLLLLAFVLSGCLTEPPQCVLELPPGPGNSRNSEGALIRAADGRMLFAYSRFTTGKGHDEDAADIAVRTSTDGGWTWSAHDEFAVRRNPKDELNVMSVSFLRLKDGRLAMFYLVKRSAEDCRPVMRVSSDEGRSWGAAQMLIPDSDKGYYVVCNDRAVRLCSGRILLPAGRGLPRNGQRIAPSAASCLYSDDDGKTWRRGHEVMAVGRESKPTHLQEPVVVELRDGRVWMLMRTELGVQYESFSSDGGMTFTAPKPSAVCAPRAPAAVKRLSNGDLLLVWNDISDMTPADRCEDTKTWTRRNRLRVAVSDDDGRTWKHAKWLENDPRGWFCYTAILEDDGHVFLAYNTTGRLNGLAVKRIPVDWFYREQENSKEVSK